MIARSTAISITIGLVFGVMLVSGPLVGSVDMTGDTGNGYCEPSGHADVTVVDVPAGAFTIERMDADGGRYSVTGPPVRVDVSNIHGCPVLTFELRISELGFRSVRKAFLSPEDGPRVTMSVVGGEFDAGRITDESYQATVDLRLSGREKRTLYDDNITVDVVR